MRGGEKKQSVKSVGWEFVVFVILASSSFSGRLRAQDRTGGDGREKRGEGTRDG